MEPGVYEIQGKDIYAQVFDAETGSVEEKRPESHKNYLDVHLMLDGREQIDLNFIQNMELKEYVPKDDFLPMDGEKNSSVILRNGDFLICYPSDGHRTAIVAGEAQKIKKAIFKVRIF